MSWFGDTFGDSLNSLKGQITKITKDVLTEGENENGDPDLLKLKLKELEEFCASKDVEINGLREENVKISERLSEEIKFLRNENIKLKAAHKNDGDGNILWDNDQIQQICELENQLQQIKIERDHLEELQKDHQSNIYLIVQQRDSWKQELEKIKGAYLALQAKYEELLNGKDNEKGGDFLSDVNLTENQMEQAELNGLKETIEKLQTQVESHQNEKEEMSKVIERHESNCETLKGKLEKLMGEVSTLGKEKEKVNLENEKLEHAINSITFDLNKKIDDLKVEQKMNGELEAKLKELTQTLDDVKSEQTDFAKHLESQVKKLTQIFFVDELDKYSDISLSALITEIETLWSKMSTEKENIHKMYGETLSQLENDIKSLRDEKRDLEREIKEEMDKKNELERKYKKEIDLLESKYLQLKSGEQECNIKSQTDDVKKLNQEVSKLMEVIDSKNNELSDCYEKFNLVTQELDTLKTKFVNTERELLALTSEKEELEKSLAKLESDLEIKENELEEMKNKEEAYKKKRENLECDNVLLVEEKNILQVQINELIEENKNLEQYSRTMRNVAYKLPSVEQDLQDAVLAKSELESICAIMKQEKFNSDKQCDNMKAELIRKEYRISEREMKIQELEMELSRSLEHSSRLQSVEQELNACRKIIVEMEKQMQEPAEERALEQAECSGPKPRISDNDIEMLVRLRVQNASLTEVCNRLEVQVQDATQNDALRGQNGSTGNTNPAILPALQSEIYILRSYIQEQMNAITSLTHQNKQLKEQLHLANKKMTADQPNAEASKLEQKEKANTNIPDTNSAPNAQGNENRPHRHSESSLHVDSSENVDDMDSVEDDNVLKREIKKLKKLLRNKNGRCKTLEERYELLSEKEEHSRKELERLKQHLIDTRDHYVEAIDDYKKKLNAAEEQLKNSSSLYTSNKVRDNQHLESLQSQNKLISAQRDSLQEELSTAQDEIQKQKASLVSLHVVLEQFQQDKERECKSLAIKYEKELSVCDQKFVELQKEKESLNVQLLDAKNGLKAASRLGEQLEKKNEYIADLEEKVAKMEADVKELEEVAKLSHQSEADKVDKSLLKNLLLGYVSSQKADRKEQVLRIMMSVLDFNEEERNKIGVESSQSGWLSSLLHPKGDSAGSSQSLSEAFIRFLENESRPQPQLKLLPDSTPTADKSKSRSTTPKPSLLLQELVLPTFNTPESSESTILKDVLNNT